MIDVDLENINFIPDAKLKMLDIKNVNALNLQNRNMKVVIIIFAITIAVYSVKIYVDATKEDLDR